MLPPRNAVSNTHFFVSVSKARKESSYVTAPLIAMATLVSGNAVTGEVGTRPNTTVPGFLPLKMCQLIGNQ